LSYTRVGARMVIRLWRLGQRWRVAEHRGGFLRHPEGPRA